MIKLIEKIEGEAKLHFEFENARISHVDIEFLATRSIETILKGRPALDALVITPRVCGICGHAHLMAAVRAIESCYGGNATLPHNARVIREITLACELAQNHIKWFYLTIAPFLGGKQEIEKATLFASKLSKAIAVLGGQYPHTSYAVPGGIVSQPSVVDLVKVKQYIESCIDSYEAQIICKQGDDLALLTHYEELMDHGGDLPTALHQIHMQGWSSLGRSYDRYIVCGEHGHFQPGKSVKTKYGTIDLKYVTEKTTPRSYAKNVYYKEEYYESGPLARAMVNKNPLIMHTHRHFQDSIITRVLARVYETYLLLRQIKNLITTLSLDGDTYAQPLVAIETLSGEGIGAVEAARGSLLHKVTLKNGLIENYEIITPTQWNLSNGDKAHPGVAQNAMKDLETIELAEMVFKTFDVCSVCTTH